MEAVEDAWMSIIMRIFAWKTYLTG